VQARRQHKAPAATAAEVELKLLKVELHSLLEKGFICNTPVFFLSDKLC
jgi:hypothetical protein